METRKDNNLACLGEITFNKRRDPLDLSKAQQLPTNRYVIERYLTSMKDKPLRLKNKKDTVVHELAEELQYIWIFMNIPPLTTNGVKRQLEKLFAIFDKLRFTAVHKQKDSWHREVNNLISSLDNGHDIKTDDAKTIHDVVEQYGIVPGEEEELLYVDNCVPSGRIKNFFSSQVVWQCRQNMVGRCTKETETDGKAGLLCYRKR